ncbi:hypothetical protein DFH29DRAFT_930456 [Suillus ampliporus]|nr:hypothetical protein DFH29DRAFT_930456 [Suillus ampliporus]
MLLLFFFRSLHQPCILYIVLLAADVWQTRLAHLSRRANFHGFKVCMSSARNLLEGIFDIALSARVTNAKLTQTSILAGASTCD